jgi:uncharacterized protein
MPRALLLFHNDMDGRACAAISARHWRRRHGAEADVVFVPCEYGEPVDWEIFEGLVCDDEVWLMDFSYDPDVMAKIEGTVRERRFIWIDHHATALAKLEQWAAHMPGIRKATEAACLLTWIYCGMSPEIPEAVRLIADRDTWKFAYGSKTKAFHEIAKLKDTRPWAPIWEEWLGGKIGNDLAKGEILYEAKMHGLREVAQQIGRPEPIHGSAKSMLLVNHLACGELGDVGAEMGYAITHAYHEELRGGRMVRVHSLYTRDPEVNVGEMARLRGGGGHVGASGWVEEIK